MLLHYKKTIDLRQVKLNRSLSKWLLTGEKIEKTNPAAIISYPLGKGKIVLSGVHIEIDLQYYSEVCQQSKQPPGKIPHELNSKG